MPLGKEHKFAWWAGTAGAAALSFLVGYQLSKDGKVDAVAEPITRVVDKASGKKNVYEASSLDDVDATWIVSPDPGPNAPTIGRSLFDHLTMVDAGGGQKKQVIPYPFHELVKHIKGKLRPEQQTPGLGLKGVLIPMGRSLQRAAGAPDFMRFPRAVIGVDGLPVQSGMGTGIFMRDRLYVGFHEKANILEIISYNEAAGRYEYQVAHDYKAGGKPQAVYANRSICLSCHQNQAPIFSDRPWQETNANPEISSGLKRAMASAPREAFDGNTYFGLPLEVTEAQPQGIDNGKFRANLIPATHFLWQQLCDAVAENPAGSAMCRAQALSIALRMGFTNQLDDHAAVLAMTDVQPFLASLAKAWEGRWPNGLFISSPRFPNRNPFERPRTNDPFNPSNVRPGVEKSVLDLVKASNIPGEFEPLTRRPPFDLWNLKTQDANGIVNWFRQMVGFFTDIDYKLIDQLASAKAAQGNLRQAVTGACTSTTSETKVSFTCEPSGDGQSLRMNGYFRFDTGTGKGSGGADVVVASMLQGCNNELGASSDACPQAQNLVFAGTVQLGSDGTYQATIESRNRINGQRTRLSDGNLVESISLRWKVGTQVAVSVNVLKDFAFIQQALAAGAKEAATNHASVFGKRPFLRTSIVTYLRKSLGGPATDPGDCCEADTGMPPVVAEAETGTLSTDPNLANKSPLVKNCAVCHDNSGGFPTNFLSGSDDNVKKQVLGCAERIWYRLAMWDVPTANRGQTPMPPVHRLTALNLTQDQWKQSQALKDTRAAMLEVLRQKGIASPGDQRSVDYNRLPDCHGFHN